MNDNAISLQNLHFGGRGNSKSSAALPQYSTPKKKHLYESRDMWGRFKTFTRSISACHPEILRKMLY